MATSRKRRKKKRTEGIDAKPFTITLEGFEAVEKTAERGGNSGRVYVPKRWIGKRVKIILLDGDEEA